LPFRPEEAVVWRLLIVEDNRADVYLMREAIEKEKLKAELQVVGDGEAATRYFDQLDADASLPCPDLVLLDINLPRKNGADVLAHMRQSGRCRKTPVMVVSTSGSARDRQRMMSLGADRYFQKPSEYDQFLKLGGEIREMLRAL